MNTQTFWKDVLEQNRDALPFYFHKDAVIRWHCTNEQFTVNEYVRANCNYPGDWDGEIKRLVKNENTVITVVQVFPKDHSASFHVVSFAEIVDGKISALDEYWGDDGSPPGWRRKINIGQPIH